MRGIDEAMGLVKIGGPWLVFSSCAFGFVEICKAKMVASINPWLPINFLSDYL